MYDPRGPRLTDDAIRRLIQGGPEFSQSFAPTRDVFASFDEADRGLAALALVSGRRVTWETFVCLVAYVDRHSSGTVDEDGARLIVRTLESGPDTALDTLWPYASPFIQMDPNDFIAAAYAIVLGVGEDGLRSILSDADTEIKRYCFKKTGGREPQYTMCIEGRG